jgi:hypothetical protein
MKGPLNVDSPIISKLHGLKTWAIIFCIINIRAEDKDHRRYVLYGMVLVLLWYLCWRLLCGSIITVFAMVLLCYGLLCVFFITMFAMVLLFAPLFVSMLSLNTHQSR